MKRFGTICILFACSLSLGYAQSKTAKSPALLQFKKETVTKADFERVYQKNNGGYEAAAKHKPEQYREYLNLYVNFKRKVFEAEELGLDKSPAFLQEYGTYKKQLAQPYLGAKEAEEKLIKEAYDRMQYVVNAGHLLITCDENASPDDTLAAYNKISAYRDSIVSGKRSFEYMAVKYSQDPSVKDNKGDLGYFNAFDMVYPFETAAFTTPKGQVSKPVRTRFGYHLVNVQDKLSSGGVKRAAHIIIRVGDRYSAKDTAQAIAKINEIYAKLKGGADFAELAKQFSDDPNTATNGGDLSTGRLRPELENMKLKLGKGEYSQPFQTPFGWHILKVTEVTAGQTLEEARPELKRKVERDSRSQLSRQMLLERLKKEYNPQTNADALTKFKGMVDPEFPKGAWVAKDSSAFNTTLLTFTNSTTKSAPVTKTIKDLVDYYSKSKPRYPKLSPAQAAETVFNNFVNESLVQYEEDQLPNKNPDYKALLKEYRDGILLFSLMEQKVWKKAAEDTLGLRKFYNDNKAMFQSNDLVDVREYRSNDEEVMKQVAKLLEEKRTDKQIDSTINNGSALKLRITTQTFEKGKNDNEPALYSETPGFRSQIRKDGDFFKIYVLEKKYPAGTKPFEKAKSECITKYQDYLEKEWLKELANKYPVKINEKTFKKLYK